MRLDVQRIRDICAEKEETLGEVLRKARVSRTAYYSLARKDSIIPRSIGRLAAAMDVPVCDLVEDEESMRAEMRRLATQAEEVAAAHKGMNPEDVRHTLILLKYPPVERLRRALRRAS